MSILNELPLESGNIQVNGKPSFASQEAWTFNGSVRDNILFGAEYDQARYNQVVNVCALERDFSLFPYGDKTLVGERGVSLSGGQKARLTLARALYRDVDIYLLDDPLSAVDTAVAKHIFQNCILDYLKIKATILVTHQIQFLQKATRILVLKDGKAIACGTFDELVNSKIDFISLLAVKKEIDKQNDEIKRMSRTTSSLSRRSNVDEDEEIEEFKDEPKIKEETKMSGSIESSIYWEYIKAGAGFFLITTTITTMILSQALFQGSDYFLSYWSVNLVI